jgi:hypothetical protein
VFDFKVSTTKFRGSLGANAHREVHAYFRLDSRPPSLFLWAARRILFVAPIFCSKMKKGRDGGLNRFTYGEPTAHLIE